MKMGKFCEGGHGERPGNWNEEMIDASRKNRYNSPPQSFRNRFSGSNLIKYRESEKAQRGI